MIGRGHHTRITLSINSSLPRSKSEGQLGNRNVEFEEDSADLTEGRVSAGIEEIGKPLLINRLNPKRKITFRGQKGSVYAFVKACVDSEFTHPFSHTCLAIKNKQEGLNKFNIQEGLDLISKEDLELIEAGEFIYSSIFSVRKNNKGLLEDVGVILLGSTNEKDLKDAQLEMAFGPLNVITIEGDPDLVKEFLS